MLVRPYTATSNKLHHQISSPMETAGQEEKEQLNVKQHLEEGYREGNERDGDELEGMEQLDMNGTTGMEQLAIKRRRWRAFVDGPCSTK